MHDRKSENTPLSLAEGLDTPLAKLSLPRLARGIARPRLFRLLDEARQKAALWIVGPGGAGKTTLAATYLLERKQSFLWYQLDKDDADPATFFYYLGIAAKQASPGRDLFLPLLTPEYLPDIPGFARRYFRKLYSQLPQGMVLVLDNYQDIGESAIFPEIVRNAIGEMPEGANILLISRTNSPPELARHQATGGLEVIDWNAIRLTLDETQAVVDHSQMLLDKDDIRALHDRSEGWAAGLTLLLEQIKRKGNMGDAKPGAGSLETVFQFFASEFFDDLPETTRDFLLKTAPLPHMTPTLAEQISGNRESDRILTDLHRRHFFISRHDLEDASYQYDALFREFLLAKASEIYTKEQFFELIRRAGRLLTERNRREEAIALYLQAQDWEVAAGLILEQAPQLLAQGRAQIVAGWIRQMPEQLVQSMPWLLYWKGMSQQFVDTYNAQATLEQAYEGFVADHDVMGQMLVASAIIDIIYLLRENLLLAIRWVNVLKTHISDDYVFPSLVVEISILSSLLSTLELMSPDDPQLPRYADRLLILFDKEFDVNQKMLLATRLVIYFSVVAGDFQVCDRIMINVRTLLTSPGLVESSRFFGRVMLVLPYLFADSRSAIAREYVDSLLEMMKGNNLPKLVREANLSYVEFIVSYYVSLLYMHFNDYEAAKHLIDRMELMVTKPRSIDMAILMMVKCLYALGRGNRELAFRFGQDSLRAHSNVGATITELEVDCIVAIERCESGRPDEAFEYLAPPRIQGFANSPRMRYQVFLIEAYAYMLQGNLLKCHDCLREAFGIGRKHGYFGNIFWLLRILPPLCAEAFRVGIEIDYARRLIRMRDLLPEDAGVDGWPWPVRIYTLGQFKLMIDDQAIAETGTQRKPLNLLEVLIAMGGLDVKAERIIEVLWPEAEGDAAVSAFTTTLSRLRKLVGAEAITVKDGRVSLDRRRCWVDSWSLEHHLERAHIEDADPAAIQAAAEKVLALYRGPFLKDEEGEWSRRPRSRLQARFSRCLSQYCRALLERGEGSQAVLLLERALEVEPGVENFYRELMIGYAALGRGTEALATYARYLDTFVRDYGVKPSQEIETLYRDIKDRHSSKLEGG